MSSFWVIASIFCVFIVGSTKGKSLIDYGYQELEQNDDEKLTPEIKHNIEVDTLSEQALEELCRNFRITVHVKDTDSYINCLETLFEDERQVKIIKRDVNGELEGSGDVDDEKKETSTIKIVRDEETAHNNLTKIKSEAPPPVVTTMKDEKTTIKNETYVVTTTGVPLMFKPGFDGIKENTPQRNGTLKEDKSHAEVVEKSNKIILAASNIQKETTLLGDEPLKTGASQEKPTAGSPNSYLMIVLAALGIVGVLAFAFNYMKKRKEERQIDEVLKLETEGRELKEMKPLMKSPLSQNGAKSLEYIDAEPQTVEEIDTRLEVENNTNSQS